MEFRVWDKREKKWLHDNIYLNPEGELLKMCKSALGLSKPTFVAQDRYIYQKSIDLYDRNNKEIYVGDYLEAEVSDNKIVKGMVTFAPELSSYIILCDESSEYFTLGESICKYIRIVGNVFEGDILKNE